MKNNIIITALIVLCIYLWRSKNQVKYTATNNIEALTDSLGHYKNKEGVWVAEKKLFQGTEKDLRQVIKSKDKAFQKLLKTFKKPVAAATVKTVTQIDTVFIPYETKIDLPVFELPFSKVAKHYSISGTSTNKGISISEVSIPNTQNVVIGKKKIGWFKSEYRIEIKNSNPLIKTTDLDGFSFRPKPKRFGLGVFVGYSTDLEVVIGVGVNYNILSF